MSIEMKGKWVLRISRSECDECPDLRLRVGLVNSSSDGC